MSPEACFGVDLRLMLGLNLAGGGGLPLFRSLDLSGGAGLLLRKRLLDARAAI